MDIIIPCLNESHHLTNTLKVLTNLIRNNCLIATIILVDNGSTDNSCEIAMSFCEHVAVKTGISIGALRNYGVSRLKGEYLVFLDADIVLRKTGKAKNGNTYRFFGCTNYLFGCGYTTTEWINN